MQEQFDNKNLYAVIMAGGHGERFWPAGRQNRPKQLLPLLGERTLIEETVQRLFPMFSPEHILIITNQVYVSQMQSLLPLPPENIIGEPVARNTAPCVALATAMIARKNPEATMVLLPSDHIVRPARSLHETLEKAVQAAQSGSVVTIGITPTYSATGYGYIRLGENLENGLHRSLGFKEKPDQHLAEEFFRDGNYRWNSGMFIWTCDTIRREFRIHTPALSAQLEGWISGRDFREDFGECPKISIDYAIMEKVTDVLVVDASFYWQDVGSWKSLWSVLSRDDDGNAIQGNVLALDANNNLLVNDDGKLLLGVIGMHDIAIVKSGNGVLVCPLSQEQKVRMLVEKMAKDGKEWL